MTMQNTVSLGPLDYKIVSATNPFLCSTQVGEHDMRPQLITIDANISKQLRAASLVHEMLHSLSELYQFDLDERSVTLCATALCALIHDNPKVLDWLSRELKSA